MALSPQERTWSELQENLHRKRQAYNHSQEQQGWPYNRYKKTPPSPLPRIVDLPSEAPLRGSHYPVIPPVANDRYYNDDTLSLQSYSSELGQLEDYPDGIPFYASQETPGPPHPLNGTAGVHREKPQAAYGTWNASTHVRGEKAPYLQWRDGQYGAVRPPPAGRRGAGPGRDRRAGDSRARQVWRNPNDEGHLQDESATIVQRHYRGYKTRKNLNLLQHLQNPSFSLSFMHHFLRDVLQNDIILDIACEVLVEERTRMQKDKETTRTTTNRLTLSYAPSPDQSFWTEALTRPEIHKPVATSLILELVYEETRAVISEGIDELLADYFETKIVADTTNMIMTELTVEMMPELLEESKLEVVAELMVEQLIDEETQFCMGSVLQETIIRGVVPLDDEEEQMEIREVSRVAEGALLETAILDHLLSTVVRNGQVWSPMEEADRFLDDRLSEILLKQYAGILRARRTTEECVPLKRLHEMVVTDVALDTILGELTDQLDEDLLDMDECETGG